MTNRFAIFITTHGRADNQITLNTFKSLGYTGDWYLVIDDTDVQYDAYIENYGAEHIIVFCKSAYVRLTDVCQSVPQPKAVVFARNAVEDIAECLGYKYFMVVDDDVTRLRLRYNVNGSLKSANLTNCIDQILDGIVQYMEDSGVACVTFGFTNTYRGGVASVEKFTSRNRLCAELFIRNSEKRVDWRANFVEDLVTSIDAGVSGEVWLQFIPIQLELCMSEGVQQGGMSEAYNTTGRYMFYSMPAIIYPNCVSVEFDGTKWRTRTHAEFSVPKIISSRYRKER
jgi:hypothetical protein